MKNLIIALTLFVTPVSALADQREDICVATASLIYEVAEARDEGVSRWSATSLLIEAGLPVDTAYAVADLVYVSGSDVSPTVITEVYFRNCMSLDA